MTQPSVCLECRWPRSLDPVPEGKHLRADVVTVSGESEGASIRDWPAEPGRSNVFVWDPAKDGDSMIQRLARMASVVAGNPPETLIVEVPSGDRTEAELHMMAVSEALHHLNLRKAGIRLVSCPQCARSKVDFRPIAAKVSEGLREIDGELVVAVMGCEVNGPGEAKAADVGVACGKGCGLLFRKGRVLKKVPEEEIVPALLEEIRGMLE